jgi:gamma-tubulin complex component 3
MKKASDLDQLFAAHSKYLNNIIEKSLMNSGGPYKILINMLDIMLRFCRVQDALYKTIPQKSDLEEKWGVMESDEHKKKFQISNEIKNQINSIANEYQKLFREFSESLSNQSDENLRFLTFRLDFNEFYEKQQRTPSKSESGMESGGL